MTAFMWRFTARRSVNQKRAKRAVMDRMIEGAIGARKAQSGLDADWMVISGHLVQEIMGEDLTEQHLGQCEEGGCENGNDKRAHGCAKLFGGADERACNEVTAESFECE